MRSGSFAGQVVAVLSRRTPAFQPRPGEPSTFPGRVHALGTARRTLRTSPQAGNSRTSTRKARTQAADRHATTGSAAPAQQRRVRLALLAAIASTVILVVIPVAVLLGSNTSGPLNTATPTEGATAPDETVGASPDTDTSGAGTQPPIYLSAEPPASGAALVTFGPQSIGATTYKNSIRLRCGDTSGTVIYDLFGGYSSLDGVVGIPNDAANAAGVTVTVTFSQEDGSALQQPLSVALGRPQKLHVDLDGVEELAISCSVAGSTGHGAAATDLVLGDPVLITSTP